MDMGSGPFIQHEFKDIYEEPINDLLERKWLGCEHEDGVFYFCKPNIKPPFVFTNGCFDLLHAGHIALLLKGKEIANRLGGSLIVALNSDESAAIKKPGRPINNLVERLIAVASLEAVDYVFFFRAETPERLIRAIRPSIWLHGYDEKLEQPPPVVDELKEYGGKIVQVPTCSTISTTHIIGRVASYLERNN